jgi:GST-like protein
MMESGAILVYLAEKPEILCRKIRASATTRCVVVLQVAHIGPMFGQANHFNRQARITSMQGTVQQ